MNPVKNKGSKLKSCFIAGIIIGILIGTAAFNIFVSYRMDQLYKRIAFLEQIVQDKSTILEKFDKNINSWSLIIKSIEVVLVFDGDEIDKLLIEKNIKDKYSTLLGKEVKKVDPDLIIEVVDKRIFKFDDKNYKLKVNKLLLTEILKIWVSVEPVTL